MSNSIIAEEAKPAEADTVELTTQYWADLGRRIARRMAEAWGAEWQSHDFDEVHESRDNHAPTAEYRVAERQHLRPLCEDGQWDRYDALKDACRDAWYEELAKQLRIKRRSLFIDDVGYSSEDTRIDRPPRHLLLQDGTTIAGWLSYDDEGPLFTLRVSARAERKIRLPKDAEFLPKASPVKNASTGRLVLRRQNGGYRHWLGRRDVHCGYGITLALPDGHLVSGRYECSLSDRDNDPIFYFTLARGATGEQRVLRMPADAEYVLEGRAL